MLSFFRFSRLYQDFDGDEYLGKDDLKLTLGAITTNELTEEEMDFVTDKVITLFDIRFRSDSDFSIVVHYCRSLIHKK